MARPAAMFLPLLGAAVLAVTEGVLAVTEKASYGHMVDKLLDGSKGPQEQDGRLKVVSDRPEDYDVQVWTVFYFARTALTWYSATDKPGINSYFTSRLPEPTEATGVVRGVDQLCQDSMNVLGGSSTGIRSTKNMQFEKDLALLSTALKGTDKFETYREVRQDVFVGLTIWNLVHNVKAKYPEELYTHNDNGLKEAESILSELDRFDAKDKKESLEEESRDSMSEGGARMVHQDISLMLGLIRKAVYNQHQDPALEKEPVNDLTKYLNKEMVQKQMGLACMQNSDLMELVGDMARSRMAFTEKELMLAENSESDGAVWNELESLYKGNQPAETFVAKVDEKEKEEEAEKAWSWDSIIRRLGFTVLTLDQKKSIALRYYRIREAQRWYDAPIGATETWYATADDGLGLDELVASATQTCGEQSKAGFPGPAEDATLERYVQHLVALNMEGKEKVQYKTLRRMVMAILAKKHWEDKMADEFGDFRRGSKNNGLNVLDKLLVPVAFVEGSGKITSEGSKDATLMREVVRKTKDNKLFGWAKTSRLSQYLNQRDAKDMMRAACEKIKRIERGDKTKEDLDEEEGEIKSEDDVEIVFQHSEGEGEEDKTLLSRLISSVFKADKGKQTVVEEQAEMPDVQVIKEHLEATKLPSNKKKAAIDKVLAGKLPAYKSAQLRRGQKGNAVEVARSEMPLELQEFILAKMVELQQQHGSVKDVSQVAKKLKEYLDLEKGKDWHVVVGRNFSGQITPKSKHWAFLTHRDENWLIYQTA
eukprot:CAMPEP_0197912654 /NCGR_PEP_ID=MMETSP1439-20131203/75185_1 /TAXON_ID=66791 /ORGANISM="Gonyaulax spinifera, Strain CCMP409" /LENGTH=764 /DNA_ID=CAMNT_0043534461 /DNA_START=66 /DNA_END=2360 /DNA_ORIENTATION=-